MIPIYNAIIAADSECGINKISLVKNPAVESNFLAFAKNNKKQVMFSANQEQQIITGVLMRCDYPIYRTDAKLGEYYITFDAETIREMAQKMLADNNQNHINIEHITNSDVEGVEMFELFIKNTSKGINPVGFDDITNGSLFATFKVNNPAVWEAIKNGEFKGFSIEGMFNYDVEVEEEITDEEFDEILAMIDEILKRTNNNEN